MWQWQVRSRCRARPPRRRLTPSGRAAELRGRVYLFRGAMGPFFSRGIDRLTDRIEQAGITANVYEFTICRLIAAQAIREYRESPAPIILIGHSMGGFCVLKFSEILEAEGIRVNLAVAIDPAHVTPDVPLNVDRFINIFLSTSVLGGGDVKPKPGYPRSLRELRPFAARRSFAYQHRKDGHGPRSNYLPRSCSS